MSLIVVVSARSMYGAFDTTYHIAKAFGIIRKGVVIGCLIHQNCI
jgi:hypothetical protein